MATQQDIQAHYDAGNAFYAAFLDRRFQAYSCAVWDQALTLEEAQTAKIERLCRWAGVQSGVRLADVGCGWGGLLKHAVRELGAAHGFGLTLSPAQFKSITTEAPDPRIEVALRAWQDHRPDPAGPPFDAIVSIGAFEHFASMEDRRADRHRAVYRAFFQWCQSVSTPQAGIGLQTMVTLRPPASSVELREAKFLLDEVFPGSALPTLADLQSATADLYDIVELRCLGADYVRTLDAWGARLQAQRVSLCRQHGEALVQHYERYFEVARRSFTSGIIDLAQLRLKRARQLRFP